MRKLGFLSAMFAIMISTSLSHAQWPIGSNATVVSGFQFGPNYFYYLQNTYGTYKTAAMPDPLLTVSQTVYLLPTSEEDEYTIPGLSQNYEVAAYAVDAEYMQIGNPDIPSNILPYHRVDFDILVFSDNQHLDTVSNYLEYLDSVYYNLDFEEIAAAFHDNFPGFYSYFQFYNDTYDEDYVFEDDEALLDMFEEWFIDDDLLRAVFNSQRMIGIDKKIYLWLNYDVILSVSDDDTLGIEDLIHLSNYPELLTIYLLKPNITLESSGPYTFVTEFNTRAIVYSNTESRYYASIPVTGSGECNNNIKTLQFDIIQSEPTELTTIPDTLIYSPYITSLSQTVVLKVNWGDGTNDEYLDYFGQTITHEYMSSGTYYPVTELILINQSINLFDGLGTDGELIEYVVDDQQNCSIEPHRDQEIVLSNDGIYKLICVHWYERRFGSWQLGGRTTILKKNQFGTGYKKHKGKITATVDGIIYEPTNCGSPQNKYGSKTRKKRHSLQKRKTFTAGSARALGQQDQSRTVHRLAGIVEYEFWFVPC